MVDAAYEDNLEHKIDQLTTLINTEKSVHLTLISAKGLKRNMYSYIFQHIITLDDLFKS